MQWKLLTAMWDIARIEIRKVKKKRTPETGPLYPPTTTVCAVPSSGDEKSMVFGSGYFLVFLNTPGVHA